MKILVVGSKIVEANLHTTDLFSHARGSDNFFFSACMIDKKDSAIKTIKALMYYLATRPAIGSNAL